MEILRAMLQIIEDKRRKDLGISGGVGTVDISLNFNKAQDSK